MDQKIGLAMAQITAQEMSAAGGITIAGVPTGIIRANFLDSDARTQKVDYYISGYVTPVGEIAAVVIQLVAVDSGIIIYSQTAQVATVADVASQALVERDAILVSAHPGSRQSVAEGKGTPAADLDQRREHEDRRPRQHRRFRLRQTFESLAEAPVQVPRPAAKPARRRHRLRRNRNARSRAAVYQRDELSLHGAQQVLHPPK